MVGLFFLQAMNIFTLKNLDDKIYKNYYHLYLIKENLCQFMI